MKDSAEACAVWARNARVRNSGAGALRNAAAGLLAAAVSVILGCQPGSKAEQGELVGVYAIEGALVTNTCGQAALPTVNPLRFEVQVRRDGRVGYWQIPKRGAQSGSLADDGAFRFLSQQTSLVGQDSAAQNNLSPQDFLSNEPDFDLKSNNKKCLLTMRETISGSLARVSPGALEDGGALADAGAASGEDLTGVNTIEVIPTDGSDCSASLQALGGPFTTLPCEARYELEGELKD